VNRAAVRSLSVRPKFRLRTLTVWVALLCIAAAWVAAELRIARQEQSAVEQIVASGGTAYFDYVVAPATLDRMRGITTPAGPAWLRQLLPSGFCAPIRFVRFRRVAHESWEALDEQALEPLAQLRSLEWVDIIHPIEDGALRPLRKLNRLKGLTLCYGPMTDQRIDELKQLATWGPGIP
jgi:hypothetical protein